MSEADSPSRNGVDDGSRLLSYLPSIYRRDEFLGRFLRIFEDIVTPMENTIAAMSAYFDPLLVPAELLAWLSSWLDVADEKAIPLDRRRKIVVRAPDLYRLRGTRLALLESLTLALGVEPSIEEKLGSFTVTFESQDVDLELAARIVETQRPAHVKCEIRLKDTRPAEGLEVEGADDSDGGRSS